MIRVLLKFIILPRRDFNLNMNHQIQSSSLWRGDFFSSPRGFFPRIYVLFEEHKYRTKGVFYYILMSIFYQEGATIHTRTIEVRVSVGATSF